MLGYLRTEPVQFDGIYPAVVSSANDVTLRFADDVIIARGETAMATIEEGNPGHVGRSNQAYLQPRYPTIEVNGQSECGAEIISQISLPAFLAVGAQVTVKFV